MPTPIERTPMTAVSVASCKRSFSHLKLILSYICGRRWDKIALACNLALLSERETLECVINFDDVFISEGTWLDEYIYRKKQVTACILHVND